MLVIKLGHQSLWTSRTNASNIVKEHLRDYNGSKVTIDFNGVDGISPSFANQLLRELIKVVDKNKVKFLGQSETVNKFLNRQLELFNFV